MVNDIPHHGVINPATPTGVITTCARPAGSTNSKRASVSIACLMVCAGHAAIHCAALAGLGLAFIPDWFIQQDLACGRLVSVMDEWCPSFAGLHLYYPGSRVPPGLKAFIGLARELRDCPGPAGKI
ncbi:MULTISPECIES: LysR substrate-binding domain-containing protein [unclassified Raoultella]|uniref:LysR substrate-binding domain-containing protein n=1 Tax=unclassified Raoultella TaxID=2627600 RepID=UPI001D10FAC6